jgi:hypothetical protein
MEIWKDINGFDKYKISNQGRIKSLKWGKERILKPGGNGRYVIVILSLKCKASSFLVHRLVAKAFIENPENKPNINHVNGIKTDNRAVNLEWCTQLENIQHSYESGLSNSGEKHHKSKLTEIQVAEIRKSDLSQKELSIIYNIGQKSINSIINKKSWMYGR